MRGTKMATWGWLLVLGFALWPATARGEGPGRTDATEGVKHVEEVARQRFTKRQFEMLTAKMIEVADLLEKAEPQTAKVLREAVNQAQRAFIAEDMEKVAQYLSKGLASAAASTQFEVIVELRKVLQMLRRGILDLDERLERIRKWKEFLGKIEKLLAKQRPLEKQSNLASKSAEFARQMDELGKRLAGIVAEQKKLKAETGKLSQGDPVVRKILELRKDIRKIIATQTTLRRATDTTPIDRLPITGQLQKQLAGATGKLAADLGALAKDPKVSAALAAAGARGRAGGASGKAGGQLSAASGSAKQAAGEMVRAAGALGKSNAAKAGDPQDQALADLKKAEKAIDDALGRTASGQGNSQLAKKQDDLAGKTAKLARAVDSAAQEAGMGSKGSSGGGKASSGAGKASSGGGKASSGGGKAQPSGNLDKAGEHMKKAAGELSDQDRDDALKEQQKALEELEANKYRIAQLKRRMMEKARQPTKKQAEEQSQLADQTEKLDKQMKSGGETPGQKPVGSASKSMGSASKNLSQGKSGGANPDQKKAIDELEKAREELADAIEQEQELAQAEQLAKIDQMLQKILDGQVKISAATRDVHGKRAEKAPHFDRGSLIKLKETSDGEGKLAAAVGKVRDMLVKEGNTVVFPEVLKEVRSDLQDVQKLLAARDAGPFTQGMQKEIERSLQEMIDSIRKELAERRKKGGGGGGGSGGGGGGKQPLVPPIAEWKMIRALQLGINRRTVSLNKRVEAKKLANEQATMEHKKLGRRQKSVRDMAKKLNAKMQKRPRSGGGM